jgi:hypothetical protein
LLDYIIPLFYKNVNKKNRQIRYFERGCEKELMPIHCNKDFFAEHGSNTGLIDISTNN